MGEPQIIGILRPMNGGRLDDNDIETIWMTLETEARKASDATGKIKVMDRGNLHTLQEDANFRQEADSSNSGSKAEDTVLSGVNYLLSSSVRALSGGKYVLNMTLVDCGSMEPVAGSNQSKTFVSLRELLDELEAMVGKCIKCVNPPPLVAVLKTVVLDPSCPQKYGDKFTETLSRQLLQSKVRLALPDEVQMKLNENGFDSTQSISPSQYINVSRFLQVKYLIISQLTSCGPKIIDVDSYLTQRRISKFQAGTITGCILAVDLNGEIKAIIPFDQIFNFNQMAERGEIDVNGWDDDKYCFEMINRSINQNILELIKKIK